MALSSPASMKSQGQSRLALYITIIAFAAIASSQFLFFNKQIAPDHSKRLRQLEESILQLTEKKNMGRSSLSSSSSGLLHGLFVPEGPAVALPSILVTEEEEANISRGIYGGKGDKAHLGGFTSFDPMGVSPSLWKHMVTYLGMKSLVDVGCGKGVSTTWFVTHGLEYVVCAEGSHDAVSQSMLSSLKNIPETTKYEVVEHDFSRGPWWPSRTVDVAWCVEFTEHVGRNYQLNYFAAFRKAALIFITHSTWGGWHHVEVHNDDWWRVRMETMGFVYSDVLTKQMREKALSDNKRNDLVLAMEKNRTYSVAQHLWSSLLVFINPLVSSLPEHAHLMAEHGCFDGDKLIECGKEGTSSEKLSPLPEHFKPLVLTDEMDNTWMDLIKDLPLS